MPVHKFERVITHSMAAIQFTGSNIKEVLEFLTKFHGNANDVTYDQMIHECKRPEYIPLEMNSNDEYRRQMTLWEDAHKEELEMFQRTLGYREEEFFSAAAMEELKKIRKFNSDWRQGEMYHFMLSLQEYGHCRLIGIKNGDWFTYEPEDGVPEHHSESGFQRYIEDFKWEVKD